MRGPTHVTTVTKLRHAGAAMAKPRRYVFEVTPMLARAYGKPYKIVVYASSTKEANAALYNTTSKGQIDPKKVVIRLLQ